MFSVFVDLYLLDVGDVEASEVAWQFRHIHLSTRGKYSYDGCVGVNAISAGLHLAELKHYELTILEPR